MTNALADIINTKLLTYHARVYRNNAPQSPTFPYVVFRVRANNDTYPTTDYSLDVKIYEKNDGTVSARTIETLGDTIDAGLNMKTLSDATYKAWLKKDLRQFDDDPSLSGVMYVNLQYTVRMY